jgi:endonuclease YncB( thermonuclease family)
VAYPPDTRYQWQLEQLEKEAKAAKLGIWGE